MKKARYTKLLSLWILLMMVAFFMPPSFFNKNPISIPLIQGLDKIIHVVLFAGFGFLLSRFYWHKVSNQFSHIVKKVILFALIYGLIVELIQSLDIIGRSFEWLDIVADIVGAVFGYIVYLSYRKVIIKRLKR